MQRVLNIAKAEEGYLEKTAAAYKKNPAVLDDKTSGAGYDNYTKYWRDSCPSLQGSQWCNCFVNWLFIKAYGEKTAKKMLYSSDGWSYYTPTSSGYFKKAGRWFSTPKVGDVIYFKGYVSSEGQNRIHHVGIVTGVSDQYVYTIEGNTGGGNSVISNGGGVWYKKYELNNSAIAGYGRPDYSLAEPAKYSIGWNRDNNGWWFADTKITFVRLQWRKINGCWYYFDSDGYAVTGKQTIDGKRYFFEDIPGAPKECALMHTDKNGALEVWNV